MKILLIIFAPLICLLMLGQQASAFNLFSNCVKESDGTQICGPCASNKNAPTCSQASSQSGSNNRLTGTNNIIKTAANIVALITGIAALIMIIISGIMFTTAGGATPGQRSGDPNRIKSAKQTLTAAIIGLAIVALAWTIISFITSRFIL